MANLTHNTIALRQMQLLNEDYFRRAFSLDRPCSAGLGPSWVDETLEDENRRAWPQSERQQREDALAATFFRRPRRMEI